MGLLVRVYGNIRVTKDEDDYSFIAYVDGESWRYKIKNLEEDKYYKGDVIYEGVDYPYSAHCRFREILLELVSREDLIGDNGILWAKITSDVPFGELIDFSDLDGCLDWEISGVIYSDFKKYDEKAKSELDEEVYKIYQIWENTFKIAFENKGVVVFR